MTYRIGVIGTGTNPDDPDQDGFAMAYRHADGYQRLDDCTLRACADIVPDNAEQFAATYDVPYMYEDYQTMLAERDLDIVSICVPPQLHAEIVPGCAEVGDLAAIHCEKPMATTWEACRRMGEACEAAGTKLTFNHQKRVAPIYRRAKTLFEDDIEHAVGSRHDPRDLFAVAADRLFAVHISDGARHAWRPNVVQSVDLERDIRGALQHEPDWLIGEVDDPSDPATTMASITGAIEPHFDAAPRERPAPHARHESPAHPPGSDR